MNVVTSLGCRILGLLSWNKVTCLAGLIGVLHHVCAGYAMCTMPSYDHGRGATSAYPCSGDDLFQVALRKSVY
jgi:hypothetical protein